MICVLEVHVQKTLVGAVEGDAALGHGHHGVVVAHVRSQGHDARVEEVGPSDVGGSGEVMGKVEELVGRSVCDNVGVQVHDLTELGLLPEVDLGEGRVKVWAVHEIQIGGAVISNSRDIDNVVVDGLRGVSEMAVPRRMPDKGCLCKHALSCVTTSAEMESRVTSMASFLVVPASRNEWASTRAPGRDVSNIPKKCNWPPKLTGQVAIRQEKLSDNRG